MMQDTIYKYLAINSWQIFAPYLFSNKIENPLCVDCMQISIQATTILSLISGYGLKLDLEYIQI